VLLAEYAALRADSLSQKRFGFRKHALDPEQTGQRTVRVERVRVFFTKVLAQCRLGRSHMFLCGGVGPDRLVCFSEDQSYRSFDFRLVREGAFIDFSDRFIQHVTHCHTAAHQFAWIHRSEHIFEKHAYCCRPQSLFASFRLVRLRQFPLLFFTFASIHRRIALDLHLSFGVVRLDQSYSCHR